MPEVPVDPARFLNNIEGFMTDTSLYVDEMEQTIKGLLPGHTGRPNCPVCQLQALTAMAQEIGEVSAHIDVLEHKREELLQDHDVAMRRFIETVQTPPMH